MSHVYFCIKLFAVRCFVSVVLLVLFAMLILIFPFLYMVFVTEIKFIYFILRLTKEVRTLGSQRR